MKQITKYIAAGFTGAGILTLLTIIYLAFNQDDIYVFGGKLDLDTGSKFGDLVGGFAGVLFTVAGVLLLYRTMQLQREEFGKTQVAITTQQFETTFFNMMNTLHGLVISMEGSVGKSDDSKELKKGYSYFFNCINELHKVIKLQVGTKADEVYKKINELDIVNTVDSTSLESELSEAYSKFYENHHTQLGHYFRYLFNIVKYVLDSREKDAPKYLSLIQAQLSNAEMGLLFYNVISSKGKNSDGQKQFKRWLDEHSLLENLDMAVLERKEHHILLKKTLFKFLSKDEINWKRNGMSASYWASN